MTVEPALAITFTKFASNVLDATNTYSARNCCVGIASEIDGSIHGIELRNPLHQHEMNESAIREAADRHNLLLLENSDAHTLRDIGRCYNRIAIETLCARAS